MRHSFVVAALATTALVLACGSGTTTTNVVPEYVEAGTRTSGYTITFPSTAAAVATESVQVFVFDTTDPANTCAQLIVKRKSNVDLPQALASSPSLTPCALEQDVDGSAGGAVTIPFGPVAVLVVATREGKDFLLGCTNATVSGTSDAVNVSLSLASSSVSVPVSTCADLSLHCATKC